MRTSIPAALRPRRAPVQRRSAVTVVAIFEATIQVLLQQGFDRLTTTRVAERAGVSVGTLYQYFPNREVLLLAVLGRYVDAIAGSIEEACRAEHGQVLERMVVSMCDAFIEAKTRRLDVSRALMQPAVRLGGSALRSAAAARIRQAVGAMLATTVDREFCDLETTAMVLTTAAMGPVHDAIDHGAGARQLLALHQALIDLCLGYLERISVKK